MSYYGNYHVCGCYYLDVSGNNGESRVYLPQVKLIAHTTILSNASRTVLKQTFVNPMKGSCIDEIRYAFPLFDGVSVVGFKAQINERTIFGLVKEKIEARKTYHEAKDQGQNAALLEQLPDASDVFTMSVANIPAGSSVDVTITYIQELKHDAEVDGMRLTIPTHIAPRYGSYPGELAEASSVKPEGIAITIDISMAEDVPIQKVISPSHAIEVSLGTLSTRVSGQQEFSVSKASVTLALGCTELTEDFVLQVVSKDVGSPEAILESHPTLPGQRALMTTFVPKFNLKPQKPELIFIADRSGSMEENISTLISALQVFLKSIPLGCMFNICSFGSRHEFLWPKSRLYAEDTLRDAIKYVEGFESNFGGTETMAAVKAAIEKRLKGISTEIMLLTDGDIWGQENFFNYVEKETAGSKLRVFPLGIGNDVSSSLIEGVARAGRGFAQMVTVDEKLNSKVVRMLKGALTPHINDYELEVIYEDDTVDRATDSLRVGMTFKDTEEFMGPSNPSSDEPISLYNPSAEEEHPKTDGTNEVLASLPMLDTPKLLQAPSKIPPIFPFNRTCVYLLLAPEASLLKPKSVVLKGTSPQGPLRLEIPVQIRENPDEMIHQLAARKATQELEDGHGWLDDARTQDGHLIRDKCTHPATFPLLQKREAIRLGVEFQVGGKNCSFVAVEASEEELIQKRKEALDKSTSMETANEDWEMLESKDMESMSVLSSETMPSSPGFAATTPRKTVVQCLCIGPVDSKKQDDSDVEDMGFGVYSPIDAPASPAYSPSSPKLLRSTSSDGIDAEAGFSVEASESPARETTSVDELPTAPVDTSTILQRLIQRQSFSGFWKRDTLPCDAMKISRDDAQSAVTRLTSSYQSTDTDQLATALATAIVILFFEKKLAEEEDTWELVVEKARQWLEGALLENALAEVWKEAQGIVGE